jgi:cytochrome bd ubiquinol oxidase subunit II
METIWFVLVALTLTVYVVLDGFDLGAGIVHHAAAKTEAERHGILRAIGPVWDGNEVWLIAAGGTLFFSFPVLYAASFSGFYLPLMMVLWLLMLRALGIELRSHVDDPVWRRFWDFTFAGSSAALTMFLGVALGNVIRGVPLGADRVFFEPLWTDFLPFGRTGILDWYTVLTGTVALAALAVHGANYIALKTQGHVQMRARQLGQQAGWAFTVLAVVSLSATLYVRPDMVGNYLAHVWGWLIPLVVVGGLAGMHHARTRQRDLAAFLFFSACLVGMFAGVAFGLYPRVLPSTLDPRFDLTVWNSAAQSYGLRVGLIWWSIAGALAVVYFIYLYRSFRGKVTLEGDGY